jgi:hypothetical protein
VKTKKQQTISSAATGAGGTAASIISVEADVDVTHALVLVLRERVQTRSNVI